MMRNAMWLLMSLLVIVSWGCSSTDDPLTDGDSPNGEEETDAETADGDQPNVDGDQLPPDGDTTEPADGDTTEPADGDTTEPADGDTTEPADGDTTEPADGDTTEPADGDTTESADGDAPICDDGDPCTVDSVNGEECSNVNYCTEAHRTTCEVEGGLPVCHCDDGYVEEGGACVETPSGDGKTCAGPLVLDLGAELVTGSTAGAGSDYGADCQEKTGEDLVYRFTLTQTLTVSFHVTGFDTVMYIRSECGNAATELVCDDDSGGGLTSKITRTFDPGVYFLFIDGYSDNHGNFNLAIEVSCPEGTLYDSTSGECIDDPCVPNLCDGEYKHLCTPVLPDSYECSCDPGYIASGEDCLVDPNREGENCDDAIVLSPVDGQTTGSNSDSENDGAGSCGGDGGWGGDGADRVYLFTLTESMRVSFTMTGYDALLHLRTSCKNPSSEIACDDESAGNSGAYIVKNLQPGTYYLWADSYGNGDGYTLDYSFHTNPCNDDPCPGTPECQPNGDWSDYTCVCPASTVPFEGSCVDNPCDPNLCTVEDNRNKCVMDLPGSYHCDCNLGYIENPETDLCEVDPNANDWAFFVFLNADNNLEDYGYEDLAEMEQIGSTPNVHIVILFDTTYGDSGHARKLYVREAGHDVLEDMGEIDMSNWQTLRDFGIWAVTNFPARQYAMIMWDHGAGWEKGKPVPKNPLFKGFSNDDSGSAGEISISNGDYASALSAITSALGDKLDIVGFDACLMGMWEVAEATAPYARYLVASEETIPGTGWPYHSLLGPLVNNPDQTPADFGTVIVNAYYNDTSENSTLSVVDLGTMDDLAAAISDFADALMAASSISSSIGSARNATQSFYYDDYRDLMDFAERVAEISGAPSDLVTAANALVTQLGISIVHSQAQSYGYSNANGLSIYLPARNGGMNSAYADEGAVWSARTTWDEFLNSFTR